MKILDSPERLEIAPGRFIGPDDPVLIVAEIGQNHQGDIKTAKEMILAAKNAGVDCVKFQKSSLKDKFNAAALERPYTGFSFLSRSKFLGGNIRRTQRIPRVF